MKKEILNQVAISVKQINDCLNQKPTSEWSFEESMLYATACELRCRILEYQLNHE